MNQKQCIAQFTLPLVKKLYKITWAEYKRELQKSRKVTKKDELEFKQGFKKGFMDSCKTRKKSV